MKWLQLAATAMVLVGLGGCAATEPGSETEAQGPALTGSVTYRERITLPTSARLTLSLMEVQTGGAEAAPLAQVTLPVKGQVPLSFRVPFDADRVNPDRGYLLLAQITVHGILWFSNILTPTRVLTEGTPTNNVEIVLRREAALQ